MGILISANFYKRRKYFAQYMRYIKLQFRETQLRWHVRREYKVQFPSVYNRSTEQDG